MKSEFRPGKLPAYLTKLAEKPVEVKGVCVQAKVSLGNLYSSDRMEAAVHVEDLSRYPALQQRARDADANDDGWLNHFELGKLESPKLAFLRPQARAAAEELAALRAEVFSAAPAEALLREGGSKFEFAKATVVRLDDQLVVHFKDSGYCLLAVSDEREERPYTNIPDPFALDELDIDRQPKLSQGRARILKPDGTARATSYGGGEGHRLRFDAEKGLLHIVEGGGSPYAYDLNTGDVTSKRIAIEGGKVTHLDRTLVVGHGRGVATDGGEYETDIKRQADWAAYRGNGCFELHDPWQPRTVSLPIPPEAFGPLAPLDPALSNLPEK